MIKQLHLNSINGHMSIVLQDGIRILLLVPSSVQRPPEVAYEDLRGWDLICYYYRIFVSETTTKVVVVLSAYFKLDYACLVVS